MCLLLLALLAGAARAARHALVDQHGAIHTSDHPFPRAQTARARAAARASGAAPGGWHTLHVAARDAHAAGVVEGMLTAPLVAAAVFNGGCARRRARPPHPLMRGASGVPALAAGGVERFVTAQYAWTRDTAAREAPRSAYWREVAAMLAQLDGLSVGLASAPNGTAVHYSPFELYLLNAANSLDDINTAFGVGRREVGFAGKCSALVKWTGEELWVGHTTWTEFNQMLRVLKEYSFDFGGRKTTIKFSSYPAQVWSGDDYYQTSGGLVVLETTSDVIDQKLWQALKPQTVLTFLRTMVANRLADSGPEWGELFAEFHSGTYTNQWIVTDLARVNGTHLPAATVWMVEELPGFIEQTDLTDIVRGKGHFGSFNVWFTEKVFKLSGLPTKVAQFGPWWSYKCPRYYMFNELAPGVDTLETMQAAMRYNAFRTDKNAAWPQRSGENAISARSDLNPPGTYAFPALGPRCHGGIDAKVTSTALFEYDQLMAVSGPTHGGADSLPVFDWSHTPEACKKLSQHHVGLPMRYDFGWVNF